MDCRDTWDRGKGKRNLHFDKENVSPTMYGTILFPQQKLAIYKKMEHSLPTEEASGLRASEAIPVWIRREEPRYSNKAFKAPMDSGRYTTLKLASSRPPVPPAQKSEPATPSVVLFDPAVHADGSDTAIWSAPGPVDGSAPQPLLQRVVADLSLTSRMRPHQIEGLQFLFRCLALGMDGVEGMHALHGHGAICADGTGLGKTLQSIAVMWQLMWAHVTPCYDVKGAGKAISDLGSHSLISLLTKGAASSKPRALIMAYDVYRLLPHASLAPQLKQVDMLICDEAHKLKNDQTKITQAISNLAARRRLLLSATPLQNKLGELFGLSELAVPGSLGDKQTFNKVFVQPITGGQDKTASTEVLRMAEDANRSLNELVNRFMLRRPPSLMKQYLPPKTTQVVFCTMSQLQQRLYEAVTKAVQVAFADPRTKTEVLPLIASLQQLCAHPDLVYNLCKAPKAAEGATQNFFQGLGHHYAVAYPAYRPGGCRREHSGKMSILLTILKGIQAETQRSEGNLPAKCVVFSNHCKSLDLIEQLCADHGWSRGNDRILRLDGKTAAKDRKSLVDNFNSRLDPSFVFLISSTAGGTGLIITGACHVVLFDPHHNPANDLQAMARSWREGQRNHVFIYRLLTAGSIEEKIFQRHLRKEGLSRCVIDEGKADRLFNRGELKQLCGFDRAFDKCETHTAMGCQCHLTGFKPKAAAFPEPAITPVPSSIIQSAGVPHRALIQKAPAVPNNIVRKPTRVYIADPGNEAAATDEADANNVMKWAHLLCPADGPDPVWRHTPRDALKRSVGMCFSDHVLSKEKADAQQ